MITQQILAIPTGAQQRAKELNEQIENATDHEERTRLIQELEQLLAKRELRPIQHGDLF